MQPELSLRMQDRILEEATRLFVMRGYDGISMREIAEACQITKAGLYYYYRDKAQLLLAILKAHLDEIAKIIEPCIQSNDRVEKKITDLVHGIFELPPNQRAVIRLASSEMHHLDADTRREFGQIYHEKFIGQIQALLEAGVRNGDLDLENSETATWILLGMMYPFFTPEQNLEKTERDQLLAQILDIFLHGASREVS